MVDPIAVVTLYHGEAHFQTHTQISLAKEYSPESSNRWKIPTQMGFSPCQVWLPEVSMRYKSTVFYTYTIYLYILDTSMSSIGYISMCWMHIYIYHGWYLWSNMLYIGLYDIWYGYLYDVYMYLSGNDREWSRVYDIYHVVSSDNGQDLEKVLKSFPSCKNQHPGQPFFQLQLGQLNHATHDHD
jgi:hypothetical protein